MPHRLLWSIMKFAVKQGVRRGAPALVYYAWKSLNAKNLLLIGITSSGKDYFLYYLEHGTFKDPAPHQETENEEKSLHQVRSWMTVRCVNTKGSRHNDVPRVRAIAEMVVSTNPPATVLFLNMEYVPQSLKFFEEFFAAYKNCHKGHGDFRGRTIHVAFNKFDTIGDRYNADNLAPLLAKFERVLTRLGLPTALVCYHPLTTISIQGHGDYFIEALLDCIDKKLREQ